MRICVYCGSSPGKNPKILSTAEEFGKILAEKGAELVYGGSSLGVMGTLADSVMKNGGRVTGVIPENLFSKEVAHTGISELITVKDMHERKSTMADLADAFVAMPGGFGTMEELFEIITWNQIGIIHKPITLLNIDGFYDPLLFMLDKAAAAGFIKEKNRAILQEARTADECIELCLL
jgi:cytokinin riboside 5'-monophosphate phosphoribohydrolase